MKKLIIFITFLLFSHCLLAQNNDFKQLKSNFKNKVYNWQQSYKLNSSFYETNVYINWQLSSPGCFGCSSFYWSVSRSKQPTIDGEYIYDIWFYSNSTYPNGIWASTYVWGINLTVNDIPINAEDVWLTFRDTYSPIVLRFVTIDPHPEVILTWKGHKIL